MIDGERKKRVLHHYKNNKSYKEISKIEKMSFRDIDRIVKEDRGEKVSWSNARPKDNTKNFSQINKLFAKGATPVQVSIELNVSLSIVLDQYRHFLAATNCEQVARLYLENGEHWLQAVIRINEGLEALMIDPRDALDFLRYTKKMRDAGINLQMLEEEQVRVNRASLIEMILMADEDQKLERKRSDLRNRERKVGNISSINNKPEQAKILNSSGSAKNITAENLQKFWKNMDMLAEEVNPFET
jgi:hypothetical protein